MQRHRTRTARTTCRRRASRRCSNLLVDEDARRRTASRSASADEVMVTTGGIHGVFAACQGAARTGRRGARARSGVAAGARQHRCARAVPVRLSAARIARLAAGRRRDAAAHHAEDARDLRQLAQQPDRRRADARRSRGHRGAARRARPVGDLRRSLRRRVFDGHEHVSIASLPGMYERTIPLYTFSKTYAMTGLRLALHRRARTRVIRDRVRKMLFYTVSNISSLIQYGGVGALGADRRTSSGEFQRELRGAARSVLRRHPRRRAAASSAAQPPAGAFYAFLKIDPAWRSPLPDAPALAVVGDDGVPDQARPNRLRPGRGLRRPRRRLHPVLLRARAGGTHGRARSR